MTLQDRSPSLLPISIALADMRRARSQSGEPARRLGQTRRHAQLGMRPDDGTKNQPLAGCLFEAGLSLLDLWIFFQRRLKNVFQSDRAGWMRETTYENREQQF